MEFGLFGPVCLKCKHYDANNETFPWCIRCATCSSGKHTLTMKGKTLCTFCHYCQPKEWNKEIKPQIKPQVSELPVSSLENGKENHE